MLDVVLEGRAIRVDIVSPDLDEVSGLSWSGQAVAIE